tara:strand:- start:43 stop:423 length:381 start_codon:yes stop_codon:yes gene_type:complete
MIITTNPPPINGIARKTGDVFGGGVVENSIRRLQGDLVDATNTKNSIRRLQGDLVDATNTKNSIRRLVGQISSAAYSTGSVDITSDNAAAILAAIQAIDPNATTIEEVQTNASASTGAENQSWSDG